MIPPGATCPAKCSSPTAWRTTSWPPTTPTRPHGMRSASAARPVPAAMSAWASTSAIPGRPRKQNRATSRRQSGRTTMLHDAQHHPRGKDGRAPDPMRIGGWMPMRQYSETEPVDFAIVGTGAGGGTLACRLAEHGFSVVAFDAGAWWRPLEEFASDEMHQSKLYWTDDRICDGEDPL